MVSEYKYFRKINNWNSRKHNPFVYVKVKNLKTIDWYKSLGWTEVSKEKYISKSVK